MIGKPDSEKTLDDWYKEKRGIEVADEFFSRCVECRMLIADPLEYHPYAACVLYRQLGQADKVRACLDSVIEHGRKSK